MMNPVMNPAWMISSGSKCRGVLAAGIALSVVGATPALASFTCPVTGGDLVWAVPAQLPGLDIHATGAVATRDIGMNVFESLITRDESFAVIPQLAETYTVSEDGLTYTFVLRPDIKFHNGATMTSADVKASFERFAQLGTQKKLDEVASMQEVDDLTFVVTLKEPQPTFLESLSGFSNVVAIMPAGAPETFGTDELPIGTGPFRLAEWVPDSHVRIDRFDDYAPDARFEDRDGYGGYRVACLDGVTFRIVTESGARIAGLEAGELNGADRIPTLSRSRIEENPDLQVLELKNYWLNYAMPNLKVPPTNDLLFRQAVQAAINPVEIMEVATDGAYDVFPGLMFPNQDFYTDAGKDKFGVADLDIARELLEQSSYDGETIVLATNSQYSDMNKAAIMMGEQLKALGVEVEISVTDWPTFLKRRFGEDYHFFFGAWTMAPNGAADAVSPLSPQRNFQNMEGTDPVMAEAWDKLNNDMDVEVRKAAFATMQEQAFDQVYVLPFGTLTQLQGASVNVKNYVPFRTLRFYNVYLKE